MVADRERLLKQGENDAADGLAARKLFSAMASKFKALSSALSSDKVLQELNMCALHGPVPLVPGR